MKRNPTYALTGLFPFPVTCKPHEACSRVVARQDADYAPHMLLSLHRLRHSRGLRILALFACLSLALVSVSSAASGLTVAVTHQATCQNMVHTQGHATDVSCMDNHAGTPHGDCHCPPMSGSLLPCPDVASAVGRSEGLLYGPAMVADAPSPAFLPPLRPPSA